MDIIHNVPSYLKIEPYGKTVDVPVVAGASTVNVRAVAGDTLDFYFPKGYIDLRSLSMFFKYYCLPYSVAKTGTTQALPKDTECLIQTLEVYLGNKRVNHITNYNQIFFLMSLFGFDANFKASREASVNMFTNGRTFTVTDIDGVQFCMDKWLGLLGLPIVLNTYKWGDLKVKLTLAGVNATTSNSTSHSWGMSDLYMRVKYYENYDGDDLSYLEFDDFKSIMNREPNYNQKTNLIVNSSRIDYALARPIRFDAFSKASGFAIGTASVPLFGTTAESLLRTWNISVNNVNVFKYNPSLTDGIQVVMDIMDTKAINTNLQVASPYFEFGRQWVCGAELGFVSEMPQQVEIGFITEGSATTACFPLLMVKVTSSLEAKANGIIEHIP